MDVAQAYALGTSSYLALQSVLLVVSPKLLIFLCAAETRSITDLETYLARALALALLALAAEVLLLSGVLPVAAHGTLKPTPAGAGGPSPDGGLNPHARATLVVTTTYHAASAIYLYTRLVAGSKGGWSVSFVAGLVLSSVLCIAGVLTLLFGDEPPKISSKTGADKRTGNFPFENKESAKEKKKEEKEKEKEKEGKSKRRSMLRGSSFR